MKYMGNKAKIMPILSEIILECSRDSQRIADPFCGSGSVSWYLAEKSGKEIVSGDLQSFAVARAKAVVTRTAPFNAKTVISAWFKRAHKLVNSVADAFPNHLRSLEPDLNCPLEIELIVRQSRRFCHEVLPAVFKEIGGQWAISKAYGGYYFSPTQALAFDALRRTLPKSTEHRDAAMAALVEACSRAAAAPGHTAQPFQPTISSAQYIIEAWRRDPWELIQSALEDISERVALVPGQAHVGDFSQAIARLSAGDIVFADPPYSDVHYSRFYHVLETVCRGREFEPEGIGRYPAIEHRPASSFSRKSESVGAASLLLRLCAEKKVGLVLTFPTSGASNGLTAKQFVETGKSLFSRIQTFELQSDFSTLGGNTKNRAARVMRGESVLSFTP
jgi:adenine-specific DNA-methyltransferase